VTIATRSDSEHQFSECWRGSLSLRSDCPPGGGGGKMRSGRKYFFFLIQKKHHRRFKENINVSSLVTATFFSNYTIHRRHSQRTHTHSYEYTHANPTLRSIFEDRAGKSSRLTKSPQASRGRRERPLPLKAQTPLNPDKFAPTGSRTQDLRCYRGSCNH
jgi:hypothetical protein